MKREEAIRILRDGADSVSIFELAEAVEIAIKDMEYCAKVEKRCSKLATAISHNDAIKKPDDDESKKKWSNKLVPVGFSDHDCESHYKCPFCGEPYRSWSMTIGKVFACNKCGRDVWTD